METNIFYQKIFSRVLLLIIVLTLSITNLSNSDATPLKPAPPKAKKIKLAILLDTSNSMDGLIDQAKSQLWNIVNEMAKAKCDNIKPDIEIALYEYGNDNLNNREGYIRLVTPLTNDLDKISQDLFALRTCGGSEFCGHVIQTALDQLDWNEDGNDLQVIFIAGNEPFTQGNVDYREACKKAGLYNIFVNTIFCGDFDEGVRTYWKDGADIANGSYMSIEHNRKTVYIDTPFDKDITELNKKLNETYIPYGSMGASKQFNQVAQDNNAEYYGTANMVNRAVSKSQYVYCNDSWDLVDASSNENFDIEKIDNKDLPEDMRGMNRVEKLNYISSNKTKRQKLQQEILELNSKRLTYISEKQKEAGNENMLDNAMIRAIHEQAAKINFVFE